MARSDIVHMAPEYRTAWHHVNLLKALPRGLARFLLCCQDMKQQLNPMFVDKCTARMHFERQSVHLYEMVLQKCPSGLRSRFEKILREEKRHVELLEDVLTQLNANPFALTPSAKVTEMESRGIMKAVKKSSFYDLMDSILVAELVDTANWELLMRMALKARRPDLARQFEKALEDESRHLKFIYASILKDLTGTARVAPIKKRAA